MAQMQSVLKNRLTSIHKALISGILILNILSLIFGLLYLSKEESGAVWNAFGLILLFSLFGNILLAATEKRKTGLSCLYLFLSFLFPAAAAFINTLVSSLPSDHRSQSTITAVLWFSLVILGGAIAAESLQLSFTHRRTDTSVSESGPLNHTEVSEPASQAADTKRKGRVARILNSILIILLSAVLYFGLFLAVNMLRVHKTGLIEVFISEYALFFSLMFLSAGMLILKLLDRKKFALYYTVVLATSLLVSGICLLPILSVPSLLKNARNSYDSAFVKKASDLSGNADQMEELTDTGRFRKYPFSLPEYFFGIESGDYRVKENILFYEGTKGVDEGLRLYFDVYSPVAYGDEFPGGNSVLIRIHGGGWTSGDKGSYNFAQVNKYFASQGYLVFDIEYGLNDTVNWYDFIKPRESMSGNFTIDDMVRHIGIFTDYLAEHQEEYHADLNSVFISGGSAGGQLALACGLAISDGRYREILNPAITVKGMIPFYPANGLAPEIGITGSDELVDPALLVKESSPPCLIYQGNHDGLVDPGIAESFRDTYLKKGNKKCAVISMPYGSHGSDLYFPGYYNQVFLYYMERFMLYYR